LGGRDKYGFLVRFNPGPFPVTKIRIFGSIHTTPSPDSQFTVMITDKDLNRRWGTTLPYTLFTSKSAWVDIEVPSVLVTGDFGVVLYAPTLGEGLGPFVGVDESSPNLHSEIVSNFQPGQWVSSTPQQNSNWMIRVVGR
jgi:hypothetical protein